VAVGPHGGVGEQLGEVFVAGLGDREAEVVGEHDRFELEDLEDVLELEHDGVGDVGAAALTTGVGSIRAHENLRGGPWVSRNLHVG